MIFLYIVVFWLGAIMGSFLNVVGLRLLREESIISPGSYCYQCNAKIKPYDNIPIFGWLLLRGRCRHCQAKISLQYPLIELLTAVLFVITFHQSGFQWGTLFLLYLICNFIVILITDFREHAIFDINSVGLIPAGLLFSFFNLAHVPGHRTFQLGPLSITLPDIFISALLAMLGAFLLFYGLNLLSRLMLGKPGFGEGDTRLLMGIGAFFGLKEMILVFVFSFILQALVGIPLLIRQWLQQKAYKTTVLLVTAFILAILPYILQFWIADRRIILVMALGFGLIAMICAFKAMRTAKDLPMGLTYLPFGPAIVIACLLLIFAQDPMLNTLHWVLRR